MECEPFCLSYMCSFEYVIHWVIEMWFLISVIMMKYLNIYDGNSWLDYKLNALKCCSYELMVIIWIICSECVIYEAIEITVDLYMLYEWNRNSDICDLKGSQFRIKWYYLLCVDSPHWAISSPHHSLLVVCEVTGIWESHRWIG